MNFFRWTFVLPLAAIVTLGLFAMMSNFIRMDGPILDEERDTVKPVVTRQIIDSDPRPTPTKPVRPTTQDPPEIDIPPAGRQTPDGIPIDASPPTIVDTGLPGTGTGIYSGPIVRVTPPYPQKCLARGTEGRVLVQFDVTPEGNVVNVRIIESPDSCFNRTVLNTVARWKYSPAVDSNGKPVMRRDVVEAVVFKIEG